MIEDETSESLSTDDSLSTDAMAQVAVADDDFRVLNQEDRDALERFVMQRFRVGRSEAAAVLDAMVDK